jgi:hypothetical protein
MQASGKLRNLNRDSDGDKRQPDPQGDTSRIWSRNRYRAATDRERMSCPLPIGRGSVMG